MCERPIRLHRIDLAYCYRCRTFRGWSLLGTPISMQKRMNRSRYVIWSETRVGPWELEPCTRRAAYSWAIWYIKCTTGRFVCGRDAALCQIILTTNYSAANRLRGFQCSRSRCRRQIIYAVYLLYICDLLQTKIDTLSISLHAKVKLDLIALRHLKVNCPRSRL